MNKFTLGMGIGMLVLVGCKTTPNEQHQNLPLSEAKLLSSDWKNLQRFPPLYPIEEARKGNEGCATLEYVVTADYEITDIKVVESTSKHFAKQARLNVNRWKWSELPKGIITEPIKTNTQFQYCLETGDGHCSDMGSLENNQCSGKDVIYSVGYRMKH